MPPRDPEELRALSRHLHYEVQMLFGVTDRLVHHLTQDRSLPWEVEMALLESFAVRARLLLQFLWRDSSRHPDDAHAADFFDPGIWAELRPAMETTLDSVVDRVGNEVAHLSYRRTSITEEAKKWKFAQIASSIGRCLRVFLAHVEPARVDADFREEAWDAMPAFLRAPLALSYPPDSWPPATATGPWEELEHGS